MISFWEKKHFVKYDIVIVGSGIVGLCAAYYLKKKFPENNIAIFERGLLPSGASTKNAGFACTGSITELISDVKENGEDAMCQLFAMRKKGLDRLHSLLPHDQSGYQNNGSYELLTEHSIDNETIHYYNHLLFPIIGKSAFEKDERIITHYGFKNVISAIRNNCEGELNTGKLMQNLIKKVLAIGVEIKSGAHIIDINESDKNVTLTCRNFVGETNDFFTKKLLICNNAFATDFLPMLDIKPGRGQVLITKPIENLKWKGIFHFNEGYYYFREIEGRILFGGGRNTAFEKENTTSLALNNEIQSHLEALLREMIIPQHSFEIDMRWAGIMAFGKEKKPIVKQHSNRIFVAVRMGGMGVAIGSEVAYTASTLIREI